MIKFDDSVKGDETAKKIIVRYENGVLAELLKRLFGHFKLGVDASDYYRERFRLSAVRLRLPKYGHEEATQLHYNHIHDGAIGKWKTFFTDEEKALLENHELLQCWLHRNNYSP